MLWASGLVRTRSGMGCVVLMLFVLLFTPTHYFTLPPWVIDPLQLRSNGYPDRPFSPGASAQERPPQALFDEIIAQMKFEKPTRIAGRFRSVDGYEDAIWIEWTHLNDGAGWRAVRNEMMFKALPRDAGMMEFFRRLKPGTSLHMTVQQDSDGNRRILELEET
jgi:hypothetical protein